MGGGSSVLSPELMQSLTQPSLAEFFRFQLECEEKHLSPVEMYLLLSKKYEDLVLAEQKAVKEITKAMQQQPTKSKDSSSNAKSPATSVRKSSVASTPRSQRTSIPSNPDPLLSPRVRKGSLETKPKPRTSSPTMERLDKEVGKTLLVLPDGSSVQIAIPTAEEIEENGIAEEISLEVAALATAAAFSHDDEDVEDAKKREMALIHEFHDPYIQTVVGKMFNVKDTTTNNMTHAQIQHLINRLLPTAHPDLSSSFSPNGTDPFHGAAETGKSSDRNYVLGETIVRQDPLSGAFSCSVCQVGFEDEQSLNVHLEHSPLHTMNLRIRKEILEGTVIEAERLGKVTQQVVNRLWSTSSASTSEKLPSKEKSIKLDAVPLSHRPLHGSFDEHDGEEARAHWRKAIHRVITNRLKQQYLPIIEELFNTPPGVKMLYAGEKIFYQVKAHADVHIYLHVTTDIVEIVMHSLPNRKQREKCKFRAKHPHLDTQPSLPPNDPSNQHPVPAPMPVPADPQVVDESMSTTGLLILDSLQKYVHPLNRIYLDYCALVPLVLGVDRTESGLIADTNASLLQSQLRNKATESNQLVSGVTSRISAITSTSKDKEQLMRLGRTIEQAIVSFLLNRLKPFSNPSGGHPKFHVELDLSAYASNPVIENLPPEFQSVPLTQQNICKHYTRKMEQEVRRELHHHDNPSTNTGHH